ncbi:hypothetical protein BC939DRAFT_527933 [Gamsiella multidivaricata]|uniref:uncharacterized protein n=1 Tax=Gamsiella multidivaricata TaxID=101098 RepID=UPI0022211C03|nr:uncharacterized protein BC939DRAFT_527933 [Gamsiella multidivaricata]KAI7825645.1 hypothetical protein BC939DRAFT_527933 [Gamsiella multidivaricata]
MVNYPTTNRFHAPTNGRYYGHHMPAIVALERQKELVLHRAERLTQLRESNPAMVDPPLGAILSITTFIRTQRDHETPETHQLWAQTLEDINKIFETHFPNEPLPELGPRPEIGN